MVRIRRRRTRTNVQRNHSVGDPAYIPGDQTAEVGLRVTQSQPQLLLRFSAMLRDRQAIIILPIPAGDESAFLYASRVSIDLALPNTSDHLCRIWQGLP